MRESSANEENSGHSRTFEVVDNKVVDALQEILS